MARSLSSSDHEQVPVVLRVDAALLVDRERRVGRAQRLLEEDPALLHAPLADGVEPAVLAVGVDRAVAVDHRRVHAPLEAVLGVRVVDAAHRPVKLAEADLYINNNETPLRL